MHQLTARHTLTAAVASALAFAAFTLAPAGPAHAATPCGQFFDDFDYTGVADPNLTGHGWTVRDGQGSPGPQGAYWDEDNISFPTVDGHQSLDLQLITNGVADDTTQAELSLTGNRFLAGTYVAHIKFADTPSQGTDGDHLNQTFFSISPLDHNGDPTYSELDFSEYLPNGGWGATSSVNTQTTWYTTSDDGSASDSLEARENRSMAGWHTVMATVANGHVTYFIDGTQVADHSGKYYPRRAMTLDFNEWLIDLTHHQGPYSSVWHEDIDYVYHAKNKSLTPTQATSAVTNFRTTNTSFTDTLSSSATCTP
ncbi:glycoside hydrolase family 16 protein [Actinacidiphila alni]|uniref:glycoside hydrolase family 16 protein n=1 Tax=Actinacidiphila alni TaxID=380248 RepID=UPI003453B34D